MKINTLKLKQHSSLTSHQDVAAICAPFFKQFNYYILNFIRLYDTGDVSYLCDNQAWLQRYLQNGYPSIGAFEQNLDFHGQKYVLWDALNDSDPVVIYSRKLFNIKYGVTLVKKFNGGYDFFNFGTTQESRSVLGVMMNQLEELERFAEIFYTKATRILDVAKRDSFQLAEFKPQIATTEKYAKLYLGPAFNYEYLTGKEILCMKDLSVGMTVPEISQTRNVSPRTVEKHIERIKQKLQCRTQCELGFQIAKLGIDELATSPAG